MTRFIAIICIAFLAACGPTPAPTAEAEIGAAPEAPAPAPNNFDAASLIGRWGDSGDCDKDVVFNADGTFRSYTGGEGQWTVNGDIITMSGNAGVFQLRARTIDANTLELTNPDGAAFTSQRC